MPNMPMQKPGTTMHSDWFGAWDDTILDKWMTKCIDAGMSCVGPRRLHGASHAHRPIELGGNPSHRREILCLVPQAPSRKDKRLLLCAAYR